MTALPSRRIAHHRTGFDASRGEEASAKMDREPRKRALTWFTKPRPSTLGQTWQRTPRREMPREGWEPDAWLTREGPAPEEAASRQPGQRPLPPLPKWPPLPEDDPPAPGRSRDDPPFAPAGALPPGRPEQQPAPLWDQPAPSPSDLPDRPPRTLWRRFRSASRRRQVGIAAAVVAVALALGSLLGGAVLGGTSRTGAPPSGAVAPTAGQTSDATALPTPTATSPAPATTTPASPFTIAFTCASGIIGGKGEVCVHTQPNAVVSLAVRYCDGSDAGGKSLQGTGHTDGSGDYTWRWNVTTSCAGAATATVTAKATGRSVTQSTTFTIAR
jgi:hypothetical protein